MVWFTHGEKGNLKLELKIPSLVQTSWPRLSKSFALGNQNLFQNISNFEQEMYLNFPDFYILRMVLAILTLSQLWI